MTSATKTCAACRTSIDSAATRCPACSERQPSALHRNVPGRVAAGVCATLAQHFGWDATLVRVLFIASLAVTGGLVFWVYSAMWFLTPFDAQGKTPAQRLSEFISTMFSPPAPAPSVSSSPVEVTRFDER